MITDIRSVDQTSITSLLGLDLVRVVNESVPGLPTFTSYIQSVTRIIFLFKMTTTLVKVQPSTLSGEHKEQRCQRRITLTDATFFGEYMLQESWNNPAVLKLPITRRAIASLGTRVGSFASHEGLTRGWSELNHRGHYKYIKS